EDDAAGPGAEDGAPPARAGNPESNGDATDSTRPTSGESEEEDDSSDGESDSDGDDASTGPGEGPAPVPPAGADGKSAYELLRERNIARNNARLSELCYQLNVLKPSPIRNPSADSFFNNS
ncbi:hypothetical protein THAOC_09074, partial [Thalassiosira oceanica]